MADPKPETPSTRQMLVQGASQAVGFFVGALLGRYLGLALGCDAFAEGSGYSSRAIIGIALIGLGGGAGLQAARIWYTRRYGDPRA
jgi:hypothetical protein